MCGRNRRAARKIEKCRYKRTVAAASECRRLVAPYACVWCVSRARNPQPPPPTATATADACSCACSSVVSSWLASPRQQPRRRSAAASEQQPRRQWRRRANGRAAAAVPARPTNGRAAATAARTAPRRPRPAPRARRPRRRAVRPTRCWTSRPASWPRTYRSSVSRNGTAAYRNRCSGRSSIGRFRAMSATYSCTRPWCASRRPARRRKTQNRVTCRSTKGSNCSKPRAWIGYCKSVSTGFFYLYNFSSFENVPRHRRRRRSRKNRTGGGPPIRERGRTERSVVCVYIWYFYERCTKRGKKKI